VLCRIGKSKCRPPLPTRKALERDNKQPATAEAAQLKSEPRRIEMRKRTNLLAGAVTAAALLTVSSTSQAVVQTYSTITGTGSLTVTHPGGGFFQNDGQFDDGLTGDFGFSGSDGGFIQEIRGNLDGGLFGTGDHGAFASVDYTGGGGFWFGGLGNDAGPFPSTGTWLAFVDVIAPAGKPFQFRIESDFGPTGNGFALDDVGSGTWQTVGSTTGAFQGIGNFNPNDPELAMLVAFAQEITAWDTGPEPAAVLQIDNLTFTVAVGTWTSTSGGSWSTNANWSPLAPDGANAVAHFGGPGGASHTVTVDGQRFAGTVRFDSLSSYTLEGPGPLTIRNVGEATGGFQVQQGNHTVSAPVQLWTSATINVAPAGSVLTLSGPITARPGVNVTKTGAGRADVSALDVAQLDVNGGTLRLLAGSGRTRATGLGVGSAQLDITNNPVVVDYASGGPSPLGDIRADVVSGFAGGAWNGDGIVSSNANGNSHGVGYAEASALAAVPAVFGTVDNSAVLLRLTRYGDANLDGQVNLQDFNRLASNFGATGSSVWTQGDFTYDGNVNLQDFNRLASNFGLSAAGPQVTPEDWSALASAVPEPGASGVLLLMAGALGGRRRRRRRLGSA
jgi:hypothetical protein